MEFLARKLYSDKKLNKPKELNNNTLIGSIERNTGKKSKMSCKVWKVDDDYYIQIMEKCNIGTYGEHIKYSGMLPTDESMKDHTPNDRFKLTQESLIKFNKEDWIKPSYCQYYPDNLLLNFNKTMGYPNYNSNFAEIFQKFFKVANLPERKSLNEEADGYIGNGVFVSMKV